jgi:hypothetical protein
MSKLVHYRSFRSYLYVGGFELVRSLNQCYDILRVTLTALLRIYLSAAIVCLASLLVFRVSFGLHFSDRQTVQSQIPDVEPK